jgi:hypothetical protein
MLVTLGVPVQRIELTVQYGFQNSPPAARNRIARWISCKPRPTSRRRGCLRSGKAKAGFEVISPLG